MKRMLCYSFLLLSLICLIGGAPVIGAAADMAFPVAAYTPEELQKVREWEKQWAGKRVDMSNIDAVAEFLPSSYVQIYKEPEKWGSPPTGSYFVISPYQPAPLSRGTIEATQKYAPQVQVDEQGSIKNYAEIAGFPFPQPKTGLEMAWNYDFNTHGDANHWSRRGPVVTPGVSVERRTDQETWELFWIHRVDVDPLPAFADNKRGIHRGMFLHLNDPPESKDSRFFNLRYIDPNKADDGYMYYAPFRRIRRISVGQRTDTIDGTDMIYDDEHGWDGHIQRNTYKLIGKKDMLCSRRVEVEKLERQPGQAMPSNIHRERVQTYVVEVKSKDPNYIYGRRVWYLDPETYLMQWTEIYDDLDRFWKCFEYFTTDFKTQKGEMVQVPAGVILMDFQRTHSSLPLSFIHAVGLPEVDTKMFTINHLQKSY